MNVCALEVGFCGFLAQCFLRAKPNQTNVLGQLNIVTVMLH